MECLFYHDHVTACLNLLMDRSQRFTVNTTSCCGKYDKLKAWLQVKRSGVATQLRALALRLAAVLSLIDRQLVRSHSAFTKLDRDGDGCVSQLSQSLQLLQPYFIFRVQQNHVLPYNFARV